MHWDWWVYYEQPPEFIRDIMEHLQVEAEVQVDQRRESEIKARIPARTGR